MASEMATRAFGAVSRRPSNYGPELLESTKVAHQRRILFVGPSVKRSRLKLKTRFAGSAPHTWQGSRATRLASEKGPANNAGRLSSRVFVLRRPSAGTPPRGRNSSASSPKPNVRSDVRPRPGSAASAPMWPRRRLVMSQNGRRSRHARFTAVCRVSSICASSRVGLEPLSVTVSPRPGQGYPRREGGVAMPPSP